MAELATIARPYAEALFSAAKSGNNLAAWADLITTMAEVGSSAEMREVVQNPSVSEGQIVDAFLAIVGASDNAEAKNFISELLRNHRFTALPDIAQQFHALKNADSGAADAHIESAFPLSSQQLSDLVTVFEKKFGRKLNPIVTVNKELIGGVCVRIDDEVFDTSVRAKLNQLQQALAA